MGNLQGKTEEEHPDPRTGLTPGECTLIKETWQEYRAQDPDYAHIFISFFTKSPESMQLFRHFQGKAIGTLPNEVEFRAHAWAVGYQLACLVEYSEDPTLLEALIRKNAKLHTGRSGVGPDHFDVMGTAIIEAITTKTGKTMTPAAVTAWEKLISYIVKITASVYEEQQVESQPHPSEDTTKAIGPAGSDAGAKATASRGSIPVCSSAGITRASSGATEQAAVVSVATTSVRSLAAVLTPDKPAPADVPSNERSLPVALSRAVAPAGAPMAAAPLAEAAIARSPSAERVPMADPSAISGLVGGPQPGAR